MISAMNTMSETTSSDVPIVCFTIICFIGIFIYIVFDDEWMNGIQKTDIFIWYTSRIKNVYAILYCMIILKLYNIYTF